MTEANALREAQERLLAYRFAVANIIVAHSIYGSSIVCAFCKYEVAPFKTERFSYYVNRYSSHRCFKEKFPEFAKNEEEAEKPIYVQPPRR